MLVEALDTPLPREDKEGGRALQTAFEYQGIEVKNGEVKVKYQGQDAMDTVDKVLVGIGRKPNISGLNLDAAGVATEMIHEMALAVKNRLTLGQVGKTVQAHPTHSINVVKAGHHFN